MSTKWWFDDESRIHYHHNEQTGPREFIAEYTFGRTSYWYEVDVTLVQDPNYQRTYYSPKDQIVLGSKSPSEVYARFNQDYDEWKAAQNQETTVPLLFNFDRDAVIGIVTFSKKQRDEFLQKMHEAKRTGYEGVLGIRVDMSDDRVLELSVCTRPLYLEYEPKLSTVAPKKRIYFSDAYMGQPSLKDIVSAGAWVLADNSIEAATLLNARMVEVNANNLTNNWYSPDMLEELTYDESRVLGFFPGYW